MAHIPKPFKRPSIDLGNSYDAYHRTWGDWPVNALRVGDIIPNVGAVEKIEFFYGDAITEDKMFAEVTNIMGVKHHLKFDIDYLSDSLVPTIWAFH